jgi:hypothetical protein
MDNYLTINCENCTAIFDALDRVNKVLAQFGKNKYLNDRYLLEKSFKKDKISLLSRYRDILENLTWNSQYYLPYFSADTIISRVKILTNGL